jgi:transposase-like protein
VLGIYISEERNMIIAKRFIQSLAEKYGRHIEFTLMMELGMMKHVDS